MKLTAKRRIKFRIKIIQIQRKENDLLVLRLCWALIPKKINVVCDHANTDENLPT